MEALRAAALGGVSHTVPSSNPSDDRAEPAFAELPCRGGAGQEALDRYTEVFYQLRQEGFSGLGDWLWDQLRYTDNPLRDSGRLGRRRPGAGGAARRDVTPWWTWPGPPARPIWRP